MPFDFPSNTLKIERVFEADRANEIVNDPSVFPWVCGNHKEKIDLSKVVSDKNNIVLMAEHGCIIFIKHQEGLYECHTNVLPSGRGQWVIDYGFGALDWMFSNTDAYEIITKCPKNNVLSVLAARKCGFTKDFTTRPIWPVEGKLCPVDVYSIRIQEWARFAPNLIEKGHWFHSYLEAEYEKKKINLPIHDEDESHDRYVGATISLIQGGQIGKAISFYNRFAVMSSYQKISVISVNPVVIDIHESKLKINENGFEVI
jgi:hypothetical protein